MSKSTEKWIDFGTSSGQVNSRGLPAHYTPNTYTPAQVGTEGNDKVSAHLRGINNKFLNPFNDDDFDVSAGGQTEFTSTSDITTTNDVDVYVNGRLQREGVSNDYTRDAALDKITFNYTVPENAWVRLRVYS